MDAFYLVLCNVLYNSLVYMRMFVCHHGNLSKVSLDEMLRVVLIGEVKITGYSSRLVLEI
jgi:hypothetical protein